MPDVEDYEQEDEWMADCVPARMDEGDKQDQAVAVCLSIWREREKSMAKAAKTVDGESYPAGDFLVVEDPEKPTTWHLQVKRNGTPDHGLMGAAWAALHGGYRGNVYEGPMKAEAIEKLKRLYASEDMETPKGLASRPVTLDMVLTKADRLSDGRVRWRARANTGEFDLEHERFDVTFWDDVVHNFGRQQEAVSRAQEPPDGLPVPILDLAHYSFRLPQAKRNLARGGYPTRVWVDGKALMAVGFFDDTPLGRAMAEAAMKRPATERRISIGVWPDWGRVELTGDGKRIYKGGRNRAYLDHLAMTAHPIDPGTILEVKSMDQQTDALDVLGDSDENRAMVDQLEAAREKGIPAGAVVKTEADEIAEEESVETETVEAAPAEEPERVDEPEEPEAVNASFAEVTAVLKTFTTQLGEVIDQRLGKVETRMEAMQAAIEALGKSETEKVKAALDSDGGWLWNLMKEQTVQRGKAPVEGTQKAPEEAGPTDIFSAIFGGTR